MLELRLFGSFEAVDGDRRLALGGAKQRAVLAVLAIRRGEVVSADRLIDSIWGESPPATAAKTLQVYVSHLRKALGPDVLVTRGGGYVLELVRGQLDRDRFEAQVADGRRALADGDAASASRMLAEALTIRRGPPLADFAYEAFAQAEIARLDEVYLGAVEDRIDAELALGNHGRVVGELEALVAEHPLRERLQAQLMLALYRSGRQADALDRYTRARRAMQQELGVEPGRELVELQAAILAQDPALDAPRRPGAIERLGGEGGPRRGALLVGAAGLLALGAAIAAIATGSGDDTETAAPNSVAVIDPASGGLEQSIPVGARPEQIAADGEVIFTANFDDRSVSEIDSESRTVTATTALPGALNGIAAGEGVVWTSDIEAGVLLKLDPRFDRVVARTRLSRGAELARVAGPVAAGDGAVWASDGLSGLVRVDPQTARPGTRGEVGNNATAIAISDSAVWVADAADNTVTRVDPTNGAATTTFPVGPAPSAIAADDDGVWVAETGADRVVRIDPQTNATVAAIQVGRRPTGVAIGGGRVWVANSLSGTISEINPQSNEVERTIGVGESPQDVVFAADRLWVSVAASPSEQSTSGGSDEFSFHVVTNEDAVDTDPAKYFLDRQRAYVTCAQLYGYPDAPEPEGTELQPEVAAGPPEVSDDGLTYTFRIRPGFAFSPPSQEAVTAASFEREIYRVLDPRLRSFGALSVSDIDGAREYAAGETDRIAGISANGDELVIRLVAPSGDLVTRLSTPWFCAVPRDTPIAPLGAKIIPSAGPYYVDSYTPDRGLVLLRNPNYAGSRPAGPASIEYEFGVDPIEAVEAVEAGEADYFTNVVLGNPFPPAKLDELDERFGPESDAARAGEQRLFITSQLATYFLLFNTARAPFDDPDLRRAVSFALDRRALASIPFPEATGRPTDQLLPPGMPGFVDERIFPLGREDLEQARRLAGPQDARVVFYICNLPDCVQFGQTVRANLAPLGIDVVTRQFAIPELFERIDTPGEPFDMAQYNWTADYPDPSTFINTLFQSDISSHSSLFSDPSLDRQMAAAAQLEGEERFRAYAELDRILSEEVVPAVPFASGTTVGFFSDRIGCQVDQPITGIDYALLCER